MGRAIEPSPGRDTLTESVGDQGLILWHRRSIRWSTSLPRHATFRATRSNRRATPSTTLGSTASISLDIAFAIDKTFGIKMPLEQWTQEVNEGKATTEQYFVLQNLCTRIDELVAAKKA